MGQSIDTQSPQHTEDSTAQGYYTKPSRDRQRRVAVSVIEGREKGEGWRGREVVCAFAQDEGSGAYLSPQSLR